MTKEYVEKVACMLEAAADYIEATELKQTEAVEKEAADKVEQENQVQEAESAALLEKLSEVELDDDVLDKIREAPMETLRLMSTVMSKTSAVSDDCGEVVKGSEEHGGYSDPLEAFAMS